MTTPSFGPIEIGPSAQVLVLTGAGVSAESGLRTFRDSQGLWEEHRVEDVASPDGFRRDPELVWRFYSLRREQAQSVKPNPGHDALAALEAKLGDRFLLVTQNVDGLHQVARSERVIEIHGSLFRTRCSECDLEPFIDRARYLGGALPTCDACEARGRSKVLLRPDIVWFGEMLDPEHLRRIESFMARAGDDLLFLAAGTSGAVWPAAGLVTAARRYGGRTILVNAEAADNVSAFHRFIQGPSGVVFPQLFPA